MGKKKVSSGLNDERFSRIKSDPMFAGMKNSEKKVVIDKRFAAALTDERFSTRAKVDMRGRKQKKTVGNNMLDLYELEEETETDQKKKKIVDKKKASEKEEDKELDDFFDEKSDNEDVEEDADDEEESEDGDDEEEDVKAGENGFKKLDLARGEGNVESSSDDDSSEEEDEGEDEERWDETREQMQADLDLANLDRDVDQVEWTSNRLAVCNLEWDNMNCEDILMLVKSFTPQDGSVVSVGIYLSDFGKEQLEKEEKTGPLVKLAKPIEEYKEDEMDDETRTAVREYLVNKLKYYYAVITFSSKKAAEAVYKECDGFQFEETGLKMDLRFIPDDMEFEEDRVKEFLKARDVNMAKYKAKKKSKCAITSTGAKIAWDEDDPSRSKKFLDAFNGDEEAGKDLIVDSEGSDDDEDKRKTLLAMLKTDEKKSKLDVDWEGEANKDDGSESSDGEYVKVDDDDEEIGVKRNKKTDSDEEEEEEEENKKQEKMTGYKAYKKKQKAKLMENKLKRRKGDEPPETNIKTAEAAESIAKDDRFSALFTDSAFAIEPSSKKFKGSLLVSKQAESKTKTTAPDEHKMASKPEDLVQKLKARAAKWNKKAPSKKN